MAKVQLKNQTKNLKVEQRSPNVKISKKQNTVKIAQKVPKIKLTKKSTNLHIKQGQSNLTIKRIKIPNIVLKQEGRGAPGPDGADGADGEYPLVVQPGTPNIEDQDKIWIDTDELLDINLPPGGTTGQVLKKNTNDSYDASWQNESSGGGGSGDWGDINGTLSDQTDLQAALDDKSDITHTHDSRYYTETETDTLLSDKADTASLGIVATSNDYDDLDNKPAIPSTDDFETTTELNARDTANRNRANHTGTQLASTISDFDTEVSNNPDVTANTAKVSYTDGIDVAANTAARHSHSNKALLDTYTQTETDLADAVAKKHTAVDISGKQDTLVSGTSIKTVNSTSLLGSGNIVVAAGSDPLKEDKANKSTTTTLGTSDTLYPTQKAVKTYVDTTAGTYVAKSGDTMTGELTTKRLTVFSDGGYGQAILLTNTPNTYGSGLEVRKKGTTGDATAAVTNASEIGYHTFSAWSGSSYKRLGYVMVAANGDITPTTGGGTYFINLRSSAGVEGTVLAINSGGSTFYNNVFPGADLTYNNGSNSRYWSNLYAQRQYLNSTAYLDGSTAGQVNITGAVSASNLSGNNTGDQDISGKADVSALTAHTSNTSNPHLVTKSQVGLSNVPNTDFTSAVSANTAKISYTDGTAVAANTSARHTHANKSLLDTYTQTEANLADAVAKRHTPVDISGKQDTLVSGTNIKTINSTSLLGSGNIAISAGSSLIIDTKRNILTSTPADPSVALSSDTNEYYAYDGTNWNKASLKFNTDASAPDMGYKQGNDKNGYANEYIDSKRFTNLAIGQFNEQPYEGAIRYDMSQSPPTFELFARGIWNKIFYDFQMISGSLEHIPKQFTIAVASGHSTEKGLNGLPYIRGYSVDMGAYPRPIVIDGGVLGV